MRGSVARGWLYGVVVLLVAGVQVARVDHLLHRWWCADELEHLHAAWCITQGQVPFRDFFEHHTPALYYLLAPVVWALRPEESYGRAVAAVVIPHGIGSRVADGAPVEIFHQAVFLSTGALAATNLRVVITATLLRARARDAGLGQVAGVRLPLPGIAVTILGNPTTSFEWYLGLLLGPGILHLLIAVTCVSSIGALMEDHGFAAFVRRTPAPVATLVGRLLPHVAAGTLWGIIWMLWLTLARGYRPEGSLMLIIVGLVLLFAATAALALLLVAATREVSTSLSGAVILAGSALAYSGASLPLTGAGLFARVWSQILPLTHFMTLQMDQVMGVAAMPFLRNAAVLLRYPLVAGGAGVLLIRRAGARA